MEFVIDKRLIFGDIASEREEKMRSLCAPAAETEKRFLQTLTMHGRREKEFPAALDYAKSLDFSKSPLKSSYLSHPLRVAMFLLNIDPSIEASYVVTAMLHNVPETTPVELAELETRFGRPVASGIGVLLVDRTVPFASIRETYYSRLQAAGRKILLIKLLDKMDNLFVLCLNPDDAVRQDYIQEVREKLLPFAHGFNAELGVYLEALLDDASRAGFSKGLRDRLNDYQKRQQTGVAS